MPAATDIMTPLWRGVVVLRIVTAAFAIAAIIVHHGGYARPGLGWAALAGIAVWTVVTCLAYSDDATRRTHVIVTDLLVTLALLGTSALVPDLLVRAPEVLRLLAAPVAGQADGPSVARRSLWVGVHEAVGGGSSRGGGLGVSRTSPSAAAAGFPASFIGTSASSS